MIDLYTVPLGATARDFFSAEAENKYSGSEIRNDFPEDTGTACG